MKSTILYLLAVTIICFDLHGQLATSTAMKKMSDDDKSSFKLKMRTYEKKVNDRIGQNFKGKVEDQLREDYKSYVEAFTIELINDKYLFNEKMDSLLKRIYKKMNLLNKDEDQVFLISKDYRYNASCTPEGFIIINMGVFYFVENEDQLAALICHELAHHKLDHFLKGSASLWEDEYSKKSRKQIKSIQSGNAAASNAMILLRKKLYHNSKIKRKQELEADSLGYEIYKNSVYSKGSFINALESIARMDSIQYETKLDSTLYKELFDLEEYKFSFDVLKDEKSNYKYFDQEKEFDEDSLASHPETVERIQNLSELFGLTKDTQNIVKSEELGVICNDIRDEFLPLLYYNEEYGLALYFTLHYMNFWKGKAEFDEYKSWLGILFQKLVEARSNYTFNRYVEKRSTSTDDQEYRKLLNFMWSLSLTDMKNILKEYEKYIKN